MTVFRLVLLIPSGIYLKILILFTRSIIRIKLKASEVEGKKNGRRV